MFSAAWSSTCADGGLGGRTVAVLIAVAPRPWDMQRGNGTGTAIVAAGVWDTVRQVARSLRVGRLPLGLSLTLTPFAKFGTTPDDPAVGSRSHVGDETLECEIQKTVGRKARKFRRCSHPDEFTV